MVRACWISSRFHYAERVCDGDERFSSLSFAAPPGSSSVPDRFLLDGFIISDSNRYSTDALDKVPAQQTSTV
jgi:hypothetical protein